MDDVITTPRRLPQLSGRSIIGLAAATLAVVAVVAYTVRGTSPAAGVSYLTAPVRQGDLSSGVAATGPIVASTAVPLNFKLSGRVAEIGVQVGDRVTPGQVLAKLDPNDLQAQLRQARANLAAAQANEANLRLQPKPEDVAAAQAAVDAAQTQLVTARQSLSKAQVAAAQSVAVAQQALASAQRAEADAASNLAAVQAQVGASATSDQVAVENAKQSVSDAARQATNAQNTFAALPAVLEAQIAQAKNTVWAQQVNRDAVCGQTKGGPCDTANAQVAAAQSALDQVNAQAVQQTRQGQASADQAQEQANQALASLKSATANVPNDAAKLQQSLVVARGQANQAEEAVKTAEANLASVQAQAAQAVQAAQAQVDLAAATVQTAKAAYDQKTSPPTKAELDNAAAQVAAQQAAVDLAQANLDSAALTAPSAGVVTAINGAVGQWLIGGSTNGAAANAASGANNQTTTNASNFISLTDLSKLQVDAQVNEADVSRVATGQPVRFSVDAYPGQPFTGKVAVVQPLGATSLNVVNYTVTIDLDPVPAGSPAQLLPGMTASVTILTANIPNAVIIPSSAISFAQSQATATPATPTGSTGSASSTGRAGPASVIVVGKGTSALRQIQIGASNDHDTQVLSGLSPGEQVAVGVAQPSGT